MPDDARFRLREATSALHQRVDDALGRFDLSDATEYGRLLSIHARAVPAMERAVEASAAAWSGWAPRSPLLRADLADLGAAPPPEGEAVPAPGDAEAWGVQYVLEGSRLGGAFLARAVAPGLPRRYLAAAQAEGGWRRFQAELNAAAGIGNPDWLDRAIDAARAMFARFEDAAALELRLGA